MDGTPKVNQVRREKSRFGFALAISCTELRSLEKLLFAGDPCSAAGLAAAQCRLLLLRYQVGVPVPDGQLREARLRLEDFLGDQPEGVRHA